MKKTFLSLLALSAIFLSACSVQFGASTSTDSDAKLSTVEGEFVDYFVEYDEKSWTVEEAGDFDEYEYFFEHKDGDLYAMVIPERLELSLDSMKEAAMTNFSGVSDDATVVLEKMVEVNGEEMLLMQTEATIDGINAVYYGYYYVGDPGSIQFVAYTTRNLLDDYQDEIELLLGGLVVGAGSEDDDSRPSDASGDLVTIEGAQVDYALTYDDSKWFHVDSTGDFEYDIEHVDGDVYGFVIPERIEVGQDYLRDLVLENFGDAGTPTVLSEEMVELNGLDVLKMKTSVDIDGIPFHYLGYYWTGEEGTVQVVFYSSESLLEQYEEDILSVLDSFTVQ